jgi:rhodanese-related sulfurtransferase
MKEISVLELKKMIDNAEDFQLIDVREPFEYDIANISGELIPLNTVADNIERIDKRKKVVVMCRSGARSARIIEYLEQNSDFENLYNLAGGINAWIDEIDSSLEKY